MGLIYLFYSDVKFHENLSCWSRAVLSGRTEKERERERKKKLIVAFSLNTLSTKSKEINNPKNDITFLKLRLEGRLFYIM